MKTGCEEKMNLIRALKVIIFFCVIIPLAGNLPASEKSKTLENKLPSLSGRQKVDALTTIAEGYSGKLPGKALHYAEEARELSEKIKYKKGAVEALIIMGKLFYKRGEYNECLEYLRQSLLLSQETGYSLGIVMSLNLMGQTYADLGDLARGEELLLRALNLKAKDMSVLFTALIYENLAGVYQKKREFNKALDNFMKALQSIKETNHHEVIARISNKIGETYSYFTQFDLALKFFSAALAAHEKTGSSYNNCSARSLTLSNIGVVYVYRREYGRASNYLDQALKIAGKINCKENILDIYKHYLLLYSKKGDPGKAFQYHELYTDLLGKVFEEKKQQEFAGMKYKFDIDKKKRENTILQQKNQIQELEITKQKNLRNYILFTLLIALVLIAVIYQRFLAKKKANQLLEEKNRLITEQKEKLNQVLLELGKSERKIRAIFDNAGVGMGTIDQTGKYSNVNDKWSQMLGFSREELLRKTFLDVTSPEDKTADLEYFKAILNKEIQDLNIEKRYVRKDGSIFWADLTVTPVFTKDQELESLIFMAIDITGRKEAEFSLRESEEQYRGVVENVDYGIIISQEGIIKFANPYMVKLLEYPGEELVDSNFSNYIEPGSGAPGFNFSHFFDKHAHKRIEIRLVSKNRQKIEVEISSSEIYYGNRFADLIILHDITEKKLFEKERLRSRQLEFTASMSSWLSKNFHSMYNNFIESIDLVELSRDYPNEIQKLLIRAEDTSKEMLDLSAVFSSLIQGKKPYKKEIRIQEEMPAWLSVSNFTAPGVTIQWNIPDNTHAVTCDVKQLQTGVLALFNNTMDFLYPDGKLNIDAENVKVKENEFNELSAGRYVKLTFSLHGSEIRKKSWFRVIEPIWSTETREMDDLKFGILLFDWVIKQQNGTFRIKTGDIDFVIVELYLPVCVSHQDKDTGSSEKVKKRVNHE